MFLFALMKILHETRKPLICAGVGALICLFSGLLWGFDLPMELIITGFVFGYYFVWFWVWDRATGWIWVLILVSFFIFPLLFRLLVYIHRIHFIDISKIAWP